MDHAGAIPSSLGNAVHYVSILERFTELSVPTPLKRKSDTADAVKEWILQLERQSGLKVQRVRCDCAGALVEYTQEFVPRPRHSAGSDGSIFPAAEWEGRVPKSNADAARTGCPVRVGAGPRAVGRDSPDGGVYWKSLAHQLRDAHAY